MIAPSTAGLRSVHATATAPGETPCRSATRFSRSTSSRFFESCGSWKRSLRRRQSLSGRLSIRSRVIFPVSIPEAIGE